MSTPGPHPLAPREAGWYPDPAGTGGQRWHDGVGWTASVTHGGPTTGSTVLGKPFAVLADWLGRMLGLWGVVYLVCALLAASYWMNPPRLDVTPPPPGATPEPLDGMTAVLLLLGLGLMALTLVTGVTWLVWQYKLAVAAPVALRRSPAAHVWWWFVPFARCWIPRGNIGDLWHAYGRQGRGQPSDPTPAAFSLWWAMWLAPGLMAPFLVLVMMRETTVEGAVRALLGFYTLSLAAGCLAALTARLVVRDLSWRALLYWSDAG
jgi:uncharacterized protein DUF4328/uncharacterized protein DUF2510